MPALRIERLATNLIGPISFEVSAGECLALMGPSGAGKSLLLRAIVDLNPCTGNVTFGAQAHHEMAEDHFTLFSPSLTLLTAAVMVAFAGREVSARQDRRLRGVWGIGLGGTSMLVAGTIVTHRLTEKEPCWRSCHAS